EFSTAVPIFCCRGCGKLFHGDCVGYNLDSRQSPPPDWVCPCCPDVERGPIERCVHLSLKSLGSVKQTLGNQPWCPICLEDNRALGNTMGTRRSTKCRGCGFQTHNHCI
ncbi:unnamed protein product, partial [Ectocarpus sp. 12 AP-2014]